MKIFYSITKSEIGGAQTYLWSLLKRAKENGDEAVVMSYPGGWLEGKVKELGFKFIPNICYKNSFNPLNLFKAIFETRKSIKEFNPDILHLNSGGAGFFGRLANIGLGGKVIFTVHGWSFRKGAPIIQRIIGWIAEFIMSFFSTHTICVSKYDQKVGIRSGVISSKSSTVIYNGISIPENITSVGKNIQTNIIFAGRCAPPKRQDIFLRSLAILTKDTKDNISARIAGEGPDMKNLEKLTSDLGLSKIVSFGAVPSEKMGELYSKADILVLLSDYEAFPLVTIEAMSYGLPVVVSDVGGVSEAVDESVGRLVSRHSSPEKVANVIQELLLDKNKLNTLGGEARNRVEDYFSINQMYDKVWKIYEQA